jgi:Fe-S cluster assembly iron-binding protein IscA
LTLEESTANTQDRIYEVNGIRFVVSDHAAGFLEGATVDYRQGLLGKGFVIRGGKTSQC